MRPVPAGAIFTNELLWWELLMDSSQCWRNRLRKRFWESFDSMIGPMKNGIVIGRQVQASAVHHADPCNSSAENLARMVGSGTHSVSLEELRKLCHEEQLDVALHMMSDLQQPGLCISRDLMCCPSQRGTEKKDIWAGRQLYSFMASVGLDSIACLGHLFATCGSLQEANRMFYKISKPTLYSWNAIISANFKLSKSERAIELYLKMVDEGVCPDEFTFMGIMKACGTVGARKQGRVIHEQIVKCGLESGVFMGSTLIDMYGKCGSLEEGRKLFGILPCHNSVSWNAMIARYAQHGNGSLAIELFKKMQQESVVPNKITFSSLLKACGDMQGLGRGVSFHNQVVRSGLGSDATIASTLVDMYAKCESLEGRKVFDALLGQSVVLWNASISGYAQHNKGLLALEPYKKMLQQGLKADTITYSGLEADTSFWSTLVDTYVKCGILVDDALDVLKRVKNKTAVLWNALITGYVQQGNCRMVDQCFKVMQQEGLKPDDGIFATCCLGGHVEGRHYVKSMVKDRIKPSPEHFNGVASLLGSAGRMKEPREVLGISPMPANTTFWRSLMTSSEKHGNEEVEEQQSLNEAVQPTPDNAASYVLMSNIYADGDKWDEVRRINDMRIKARAWKKPGKAWVEIKSKVHEFIVGDKTHQESTYIYNKLRKIKRQMNDTGYVPNVELVLENRSFSDPFKPK